MSSIKIWSDDLLGFDIEYKGDRGRTGVAVLNRVAGQSWFLIARGARMPISRAATPWQDALARSLKELLG